MDSGTNNKPSVIYIDAIEESVVSFIPTSHLNEFQNLESELLSEISLKLRNSLIASNNRIISLLSADGINIEFTLETPERFKRVVTTNGLKIEGVDGIIRSASERLDVNEILNSVTNKNLSKILSDDSYIGHIHLYASSVKKSNEFYNKMGFEQFNYLPQFMYADLGAGGDYQHRIVMNSWHGQNKPLAPDENAGLRFFQINFKNEAKLISALKTIPDYVEIEGGYRIFDTTGNMILIRNT
jgi:catechol 2,3-dioxygenase